MVRVLRLAAATALAAGVFAGLVGGELPLLGQTKGSGAGGSSFSRVTKEPPKRGALVPAFNMAAVVHVGYRPVDDGNEVAAEIRVLSEKGKAVQRFDRSVTDDVRFLGLLRKAAPTQFAQPKVMVLQISATWCEYCKATVPVFRKLTEHCQNADMVESLEPSILKEPKTAARWMSGHSLRVLGPNDPRLVVTDPPLNDLFSAATLPATVVLVNGQVVYQSNGRIETADGKSTIVEGKYGPVVNVPSLDDTEEARSQFEDREAVSGSLRLEKIVRESGVFGTAKWSCKK
jgi:thiol-disulfide isomerase/thioredoxin